MKQVLLAVFSAALLLALFGVAPVAEASCNPCTYIWFNGWNCDNTKNSSTSCETTPAGCRSDDDDYCMKKYGPGSGNVEEENQSRLFYDNVEENWVVASTSGSVFAPDFETGRATGCTPIEPYVIY